jgi:SAM-dependent methyltransferase
LVTYKYGDLFKPNKSYLMKNPHLIKDESTFSIKKNNYDHARLVSLNQCLERNILINPERRTSLITIKQEDSQVLTDGKNEYPILFGSPVLYPSEISLALNEGALPLQYYENSLRQYLLLSQIKQRGEINAPLDSLPARKHQYRYKEFCKDLNGLILDIGSDKPSHSSQFLPVDCEYLGLDPYAGGGEFRIIGLGEILPIASESVSGVTFNTSLDHILDHHTAIEEAFRVLHPGGKIIIATYAWSNQATLLTDSVHFHHFREYEILGALESKFKINIVKRYEDPKFFTHRYGMYVMAEKK